jgi:putative glutamine amidotransferase
MSNRRIVLIGITADIDHDDKNGPASMDSMLFLPQRYCRALAQAGGVPVVLPPTGSRPVAIRVLDRLDGLLISGGNFDIHPSLYGERPIAALGQIKPERTKFELNLARLALKRDLPLLGICGGAQAINVVMGGTLYQDIATQITEAIEHQQSKKRNIGGHEIQIRSGTRLAKIVGRPFLEVNTTHHQAVKRLGAGLLINATSEDGLIEGIESSRHSFVLGVQWHPEALAARSFHQRKIFSAFVEACRSFGDRR